MADSASIIPATDSDKIMNPVTGRLVSKTGPTGRKILTQIRLAAVRQYQKDLRDGKIELHWEFPLPLEEYAWRDPPFIIRGDTRWVLPCSREFPSFIDTKFSKFRLTKDTTREDPTELHGHQKFVKAYMSPASPYRGLLLYHGLGGGKSRSAIEVSEEFRTSGIQILVMTPASLQGNFRNEIRKWGKGDLKLTPADSLDPIKLDENDRLIDEYYFFVNYNGNPLKRLKELGIYKDELTNITYPPTNMLIIIDEVHNLIHRMLNEDSRVGPLVGQLLLSARNCKFITLTGTPMIDSPQELAVLFNMIRGPMRSGTSNYSLFPTRPDEFNQWFIEDKGNDEFHIQHEVQFKRRITGLVSYYQGVIESYPGEYYPEMIPAHGPEEVYVRMSPEQYEHYMKARDKEDAELKRKARQTKILNSNEFKSSFRSRSRMLGNYFFPPGMIPRPKVGQATYFGHLAYDVPNKLALNPGNWSLEQKRALAELIGHSSPTYAPIKPEQLNDDHIIIYDDFVEAWKNAPNLESRGQLLAELILGSINYPEPLIAPKTTLEPLITHANLDRVIAYEGQTISKYADAVDHVLTVMRATPELFTQKQMAINSPKMWAMWEEIKNCAGPVLVYSNYKTLEGVGIFAELLHANGYQEISLSAEEHKDVSKLTDRPRYAFYTGSDGESETIDRDLMVNIFNHPANQDPKNPGSKIKVILATSAAAEGLSFKGLFKILIMETHWNRVRVYQVIGRGRRLDSHNHYPIEMRKVEVKMFYAVPPPEFPDQPFEEQLSVSREELTKQVTDLYLDQIALKKKYLSDKFMHLLKMGAVDCSINSAHHKALNLTCAVYPKDMWSKVMYRPNYQSDPTDVDTYITRKPFYRKLKDPSKQHVVDKMLLHNNKPKYYTKEINGITETTSIELKGKLEQVSKLFFYQTHEASTNLFVLDGKLIKLG